MVEIPHVNVHEEFMHRRIEDVDDQLVFEQSLEYLVEEGDPKQQEEEEDQEGKKNKREDLLQKVLLDMAKQSF